MLLSNIQVAYLLSYSKNGTSNRAKESKNWRIAIKNETGVSEIDAFPSEFISKKIQEQLCGLEFKHYFGQDVVLVPVPRSSFMQPGSLWVPQRYTTELAEKGLGISNSLLERATAVRTSHTAPPEDRPKAQEQYASLRVKETLDAPRKILLVDDFVVTGKTMLASASVLRDAFPTCEINCFAVMRVLNNPSEFIDIWSPHIANVQLRQNGLTVLRV